MSQVRTKGTSPELALRSALHSAGIRFRLYRKDLPGKPDIVLPKYKSVIFLHGCFWHHHEGCFKSKMPKTNVEFWQDKIAANIKRDKSNQDDLAKMGWRTFVVWECDIKRDLSGVVMRLVLIIPLKTGPVYGENVKEPIMRIHKVTSFIQEIQKLPQDPNFIYFFRGHSNAKKYKIEPSIYRNNNLIKNEDHLFKELVLHNPEEFEKYKTTIEYLVLMQHYSLPTRLLDLTTNPLIALYFTSISNQKKSGEVIVFKVPKNAIKYYDSDTVSVIANIAKRPHTFTVDHSLSKDDFNKQDDIGYLLHEIGGEKPHFKPLIVPDDINRVICVKVKQDNPRIVNQSGAFLLFGINGDKTKIAVIDPTWLPRKTDLERIYIFSKARIIKELELMGITTALVYPEMENYAKKLKEFYEK